MKCIETEDNIPVYSYNLNVIAYSFKFYIRINKNAK